MTLTLDDLTVPPPPAGPADWNDTGAAAGPIIDDTLIDAYTAEWHAYNGWRGLRPVNGTTAQRLHADRPGGWPDCTPYMRHPALRRLVCDGELAAHLEELIGEPAAVHLNLTGWTSTTRDWHQDAYLNEPEVGDHYAAVWIALGDIDPDAGPFQIVEGSHRWPQVTRETIGRHLDVTDPAWPARSETILSPLFEAEIERRGARILTPLLKRGQTLAWHGRLLHRGSLPKIPGAYRPAVIAHYSGIHHRPAMPSAVQHEAGGWFFPITAPSSVR